MQSYSCTLVQASFKGLHGEESKAMQQDYYGIWRILTEDCVTDLHKNVKYFSVRCTNCLKVSMMHSSRDVLNAILSRTVAS